LKRDLYEKLYELPIGFYQSPAEVYVQYRMKEKILKHFETVAGERKSLMILDIGCNVGTDLFMLYLVQPENIYLGVDISENAIRIANRLSKLRARKVSFLVASATALPFRKEILDLALSSETIEHLKLPESMLLDVNKALKPKGYLILTTPNRDYLLGKLARNLPQRVRKDLNNKSAWSLKRHSKTITADEWEKKGHVSVMSYDALARLLSLNGFEVEKTYGSSIFGGHHWLDEHPVILSLLMLLDNACSFRFAKRLHFNIILRAKKR